MFRNQKLLPVVLSFFATLALAKEPESGRVIDDKFHHLGSKLMDYGPQVSPTPESTKLEVRFKSAKNKSDFTLSLVCWDVNYPAPVTLNGKKIGDLYAIYRKLAYLNIPAGALQDGENLLTIARFGQDDCVVGKIIIHPKPFAEVVQLRPVNLSVTDATTGKPTPARITITDTNGNRCEIFSAPTNGVAVRSGLIYTRGTETPIQLSEGTYHIYATRGMEWSRDKQTVSVVSSKATEVKLRIQREVNTRGYVAADTHIHTLTFSGHGDAKIDERMITLAGEGVELAVSTDHNHHTDYRPFQEKMLVTPYFTPVTGNEVTTKVGHFNAFPMPPEGEVPDHHEQDWVKLVDDIRSKGAKVVILNHPHWTPNDVFATNGLNSVTGSRANGVPIPFDGMELINSCATLTNGFTLLRDWLALLNHGEKIKAVGASDSHTVDSPVGQGRTYLRSSTDDASKINIDEAVTNFLAGRSSVSMGIFTEVFVNGKSGAGSLVPTSGNVSVRLRVASPSWIKPKRAFIFCNGGQVAEKAVPIVSGKATDVALDFTIPAPQNDAHVVCFVIGEGVHEPCWETERDYTLAATNPVFLDADHDGVYRTPRETAQTILSKADKSLDSQWSRLMQADYGVATQLLDLIYADADKVQREALTQRLAKASGEREVFGQFLQSLAKD